MHKLYPYDIIEKYNKMDLFSPKDIQDLISQYGAKPRKGLGQNFLIDKNILSKIIDCADLKSDDFVLEVGPGLGTLTQELAKKAGQVVAVEKDKTMIEILKETLKNSNNVKIIQGDILQVILGFLPAGQAGTRNPDLINLDSRLRGNDKFKVVANIPYYLTSPLIRLLLENENPPEAIVLLLQKEVAERICSKPGDMSLLAVSVQFYADAKIISLVPKNYFWPAPKVDSAIIKIIPRSRTSRPAGSPTSPDFSPPDLFFKIVKAGFSHPRKQLLGNLSGELNLSKEQTVNWLSKNNLNPKQRAETLSVQDWKNLANTFEC